jgi:hypothetical protein
MEIDDIIRLERRHFDDIYPSDSRTARLVSAEFDDMIPHLNLNYDPPIYCRVVFLNGTVAGLTTFPQSTEIVGLLVADTSLWSTTDTQPITDEETLRLLGVLPVADREMMEPDPEVLAMREEFNEIDVSIDEIIDAAEEQIQKQAKKPAEPAPPPVIKKDRRSEMIECLDQMFPDNYEFTENMIIIRFPEIQIRNSAGAEHLIRDLFVKLDLRYDLRSFNGTFTGMRTSVTQAEVNVGYRHSHLPRSGNGWRTFCLGGGSSMNRLVMDMVHEAFDVDMFYIFLVHLNDYVRWESLEGGPHVRLNEFRAGTSNSVLAPPAFPTPNQDSVRATAKEVLTALTHSEVERRVLCDGSFFYALKFSGNAGRQLMSLIDIYTPGSQKYSFNTETGAYTGQAVQASASNASSFLANNSLSFKGQTMRARILDSNETQSNSIILRPSPQYYRAVIEKVTALLNNEYPEFLGVRQSASAYAIYG